MKKEVKKVKGENKQVVKFHFVKHLLKKRAQKHVIPESQLCNKLKLKK